jgi:DNA-binding NtrC family response regulator
VKRILVVDDDASIRETFARTLGRWSYAVTVAASAEEALAGMRRIDPAVVITDVRMPGIDGLELLRTLRERAPDTDIIVITAFEEMRTAVEAMKAGAFEYLVKPLDLDQIELVLERCFAHRQLRERARQQVVDAEAEYSIDRIAGRDPRMIEIYKVIGQVAATRAPVLIRGETGTGKELIARAIHFNSPAAAEPFVAVNCTAIPEALLESELFGHKRGAFTGAISDRRGRFALAGCGTLFLDEIGDTSGAFQAKLLRVLQDREFSPVGADHAERTEARVIAATHRNLEELVRGGRLREDLYFRLRVVEIVVPPLRERRADIPVLIEHFVRKIALSLHQETRTLTPAAIDALTRYSWPGNVRELENTLTRALVLARGGVVDDRDLALGAQPTNASSGMKPSGNSLREVEAEHVRRILVRTSGNKRRAARILGVSRARLDRLIARHGLSARGLASRPDSEEDGIDPAPSESGDLAAHTRKSLPDNAGAG